MQKRHDRGICRGIVDGAAYHDAVAGFKLRRNFIDDNYHVKEGLPELSISHFIELNAYVGEDGDISDIVDMYLDGTLVDGMSTKDVRNALNSKKDVIEKYLM